MPLRILVNDKVRLDDERTGVVRFIGNVSFAKGEWVGLALDDPFNGKNDGMVKGKRYFQCKKNKGTFVRRKRVVEVKVFASNNVAKTLGKAVLAKDSFKVGFRVSCDGRLGTVRFIGTLDRDSDDQYLGLELDQEFKGTSDGSRNGKRYFLCAKGQGIFVKPEKVIPIGENKWAEKKDSPESFRDDNEKVSNPRTENNENPKNETPYSQVAQSSLNAKWASHSTGRNEKFFNGTVLKNRADHLVIHKKSRQSRKMASRTKLEVSEAERMVLLEKLKMMEKNMELIKREHTQTTESYEHSIMELEKEISLIKQDAKDEIKDLQDELEKAEGKNISPNSIRNMAKVAMRKTETDVMKLRDKLLETEERCQRTREWMNKELELFLQEKKEFRNDKSEFSAHKVELVNERKRLENLVREKDTKLNGYIAKYEMVQKQLNSAMEEIGIKSEENTTLRQGLQRAHMEIWSLRKALKSERKVNLEQQEKDKEILRTMTNEKKLLEEELVLVHNKLRDTGKKTRKKFHESEVDAVNIDQNRIWMKEKGASLWQQRAEISERVSGLANNSGNWKNLTQQNILKRDDFEARRTEIEKQKSGLAEVQSGVRNKFEKVRSDRARFEETSRPELELLSKTKSSLGWTYLNRISHHSSSSEIQDVNAASNCQNLRINIPDSELTSEEDVDDESVRHFDSETPVAEGFIDEEGRDQHIPNCESSINYQEIDQNNRLNKMLNSSPIKRRSKRRRNHKLRSPIRSQDSSKHRSSSLPRVWRPREKITNAFSLSNVENQKQNRMFASKVRHHSHSRRPFCKGHFDSFSEGYTDSESDSVGAKNVQDGRSLKNGSESTCVLNIKEAPVQKVSSQNHGNDSWKSIELPTASKSDCHGDFVGQKSERNSQHFQKRDLQTETNRIYNLEVDQIWVKVKNIYRWVVNTKANISSLNANSSTLNDNLATITSQRTKQIKEKLRELSQLIEKRKQLTNSSERFVQNAFLNRAENLLILEKECERELKNLEKDANHNQSKVAIHPEKDLPQFISEYWQQSRKFREIIQALQYKCDTPIPARYKTIEEINASLEDALSTDEDLRKLEKQISHLKKMVDCIGKIHTAKTEDCLSDATDLEMIYSSVCKSSTKKTETIRNICNERLKEEKLHQMKQIDKLNKGKYMKIMEAADQKMGELSECGQSRNQQSLSRELIIINRILQDDLPKWRNCVSTEMAKASAYLKENEYEFAQLVSERETTLRQMIKQTEQRAVKVLTKVQELLD